MEPNRNSRHALVLDLLINVLLWLGVIIAATIFVYAGWSKLTGVEIGQFEAWGYTPAFAVGIGVIEVVGGIGLLIPRTSGWASLALVAVMLGTIGTHLGEADYGAALAPVLMVVVLSFVLFARGVHRLASPQMRHQL